MIKKDVAWMTDTDIRKLAELPQVVTIATTEHNVLAATRATIAADSAQRSTMFFTSVSSALIALAFVSQVASMGRIFIFFACTILSTLTVVGLLTYARIVQQAMEDTLLVHGMNRIRHWYSEVAPELTSYFVTSTHDDYRGVMSGMGLKINSFQSWLTTACTLALVNSVLAGSLVGVAVTFAARARIGIAMLVAFGGFVVALWVHQRISCTFWKAQGARYEARFPSQSHD